MYKIEFLVYKPLLLKKYIYKVHFSWLRQSLHKQAS
jgi:hypothetical protein